MRLACCITELDPGGAERALVQIATRLAARGWTIKVFCLGASGEMAEPLLRGGVEVECLGGTAARGWQTLRRLTHGLKQWRPDVVQTFLFHANILGRLAARRSGCRAVCSGVRVAERDAPWRMRLDRWTQRYVTMNVCVSQGVADFMQHQVGLSPTKLTVIPNGVEFERFANAAPARLEEFGIPPGSRTLLFVGRLHPQKGPDLLLDAVAPLLRSSPDLHLLLVGDGPLRGELEEQAARTLPTDQVHFAGRISDVASLYAAAAALVLPSRWEGMPNALLEGMAAGCPVVATDVEGVRELFPDQAPISLCKPQSAEDLRRSIERVLTDREGAKRCAEEAQLLTRESFAWERVTDGYADLYRKLLSSTGPCG